MATTEDSGGCGIAGGGSVAVHETRAAGRSVIADALPCRGF